MGMLIQEMELNPYEDILGTYYTEHIASSDQSARGEFYTPRAISSLMAKISMDIDQIKEEGKPVSICDPCSGSGSTILACAEHFKPDIDLMRVTLQDVNVVACDMAFINTTLWGIPAEIILGNTLTMDITAAWKNIHWHRVGEDQRRKTIQMFEFMKDLTNPDRQNTKQSKSDRRNPPSDEPQIQLGLF